MRPNPYSDVPLDAQRLYWASCERFRKAQRRRSSWLRGLAGYHPVAQAARAAQRRTEQPFKSMLWEMYPIRIAQSTQPITLLSAIDA